MMNTAVAATHNMYLRYLKMYQSLNVIMHFESPHIIHTCAVCLFFTAAGLLSTENIQKPSLQTIKQNLQGVNGSTKVNFNFPDEEWYINMNTTEDGELPEVIFDLYNSMRYRNGSLFKNGCDTARISFNNEVKTTLTSLNLNLKN